MGATIREYSIGVRRSLVPNNPTSKARFVSVDVLRSLAILIMVFVHFAVNLSGVSLPITGLGAPMFAFLAGLSYTLWSSGLKRKGHDEAAVFKASVRRGLFVFGVGIAFNVLVWLPEDIFNWDVLTFIGSALLVLNLLRRMDSLVILFAAVLCTLVAPALGELVGYADYWTEKYFNPDMTLADVCVGFFVAGYFPIFPWLTYPLCGMLVARQWFVEPSPDRKSTVGLAGLGAALLAVGGLMLVVADSVPAAATPFLAGWRMYPPSWEYVLVTLGSILLLLWLAHGWFDRPHTRGGLLIQLATRASRLSLTIYIVHHVVHLWPLWGLAAWRGSSELTEIWRNAMALPGAMILAALFVLAGIGYLIWNPNSRNRYSIEYWMRWLCD